MPTILQSDKLATLSLGSAASFGLNLPAYLDPMAFAAAYSMRKVRQAYSGYALNAYNTTSGAEAYVAFDSYRVTASSLITVFTAGTSGYTIGQTMTLATFAGSDTVVVGKWYDQSGNGRDLSCVGGVGANYPTLYASGVMQVQNGIPVLVFDGVNDYLQVAFARTQPHVMVAGCVTPGANGSGYGQIWSASNAGATDDAANLLCVTPNATKRSIYGGATIGDGADDSNGQLRVYATCYNGASSKLYVNGTQVATGNAGALNPIDLRVGKSWNNSTTTGTNLKLWELLLPSDATTDLAVLSRNLLNFWGL